MKKLTLVLILQVTLVFVAIAQIDMPEALKRQVEGKTKFEEIKSIVQNYYALQKATFNSNEAETKKINRQLKMWRRWEMMNYGHLDESGNITNTSLRNFEAFRQLPATPSSPNATESAYGVWSEIGPKAYNRFPGGHNGGLGRVNCVAFHPSNANIIYIGTPAGGLWRSTDAGTNWAPLTDHIPSIGVSGIAIHPSNPNIIYILTGDGDAAHRACIGVMKTTDGGVNWAFTGNFPSVPAAGFRGYKLLMDPTNSNILFAATDQGIYKTSTAGDVWTRTQTGWFTDIEFKPGDHNIMYAARMLSAAPFYRSTNNGDNFSTAGITGVPANATRIAIGVSVNNPTYVYIHSGPATAVGMFTGVHRSFDSGLDFDPKANTPNILGYDIPGNDASHQTTYDLAIEVNPANVANVLTGGINVWRSGDFGNSFVNATEWFEPSSPVSKYVHADIHNLAYNPLNNWLYVCSDGGLSVSTDHGVTWTQRWNTLQLAQYYMMSGYDADQNRLIGGLQDNGTMYKKSASLTFDHVEGADGYHALIDYTDPNIIFFDENDGLNWSIDGGTNVAWAGLNNDCWPALAMHSTNHNIIFAGRCDGVYKKTFPGGAWVNTGARGENRMLTCPSNNQRVYAYGNATLYRTDNEGTSWAPAGPPTHPPSGGQPITDMAVNPSFSGDLFVCVGGYTAGQKVYYSGNAGATWTNISGSLPNAACGAIAVDNALGVYVGTDVGVFYRPWASAVWLPFYNWLPKVPVTDLYINNAAGSLTASTFGRGIWRSDLYSACSSTLFLGGTVAGNRLYEAGQYISSTHIVQGGEGTEFFYKAGDSIVLRPGFEAKSGSKLKAFIGPCATGIPTFRLLNNAYGISDIKMLVKEPVQPVKNAQAAAGNFFVSKNNNGVRELQLNLSAKKYIQVWYERAADHEAVAWIVKENMEKGVYRIQLTDEQLNNKNLKLVVQVGDDRQEISL